MKGDVTPDLERGQRVFHAYEDDSFKFGKETITTHFYFHQGKVVQPWSHGQLATLNIEDFSWLENEPPEMLIVGTGRRTNFPNADVLDYLSTLHIGFECMDSRSAARTFNLLVGEGRIIAAAMLLPNVRG